MPKPFLIIQLRPEDAAADDELQAICRYASIKVSETARRRAERDGLPTDPAAVRQLLDQHSGIIVGGSPFDVSTPEAAKSALQKTVEAGFRRLFDAVVARDYPFLGCCSGNGLLGSYLGARISTRYGETVGGADILLTEEGREDPLLQGVPPRFRALLGHKEACDESPPRSVLLASSSECPVQMFRVGANVYATQFHPEGDAAGFKLRIDIYKDYGYFPAETADELAARLDGERTPHAQRILHNFVSRYRAAN